jgi:hypothetical protein
MEDCAALSTAPHSYRYLPVEKGSVRDGVVQWFYQVPTATSQGAGPTGNQSQGAEARGDDIGG